MHEKPLLLASAKSGVLVASAAERRAHWVRMAALVVGLLCVLVGAADLASRVATSVGGDNAALTAFGPAAALGNPQFVSTNAAEAITPVRMRIPSLGVDAQVEAVGIKADGSMGTPKDFKDVSWYSLGAKPGAAGSAVFAGHVNNGLVSAGVFSNLSQIKKGDYVTLADNAGRTKVYRVESVQEYEANASTEALFATNGPSQLVLITCDGDWVPAAKTFDKRLVVIAKPAY